MNLGGGGAFSAALAAPVLAPPPVGVETSFDTAAPSGGKSNKPLIFAILGAACILALAFVFVMKGNGDKDKTAGPGGPTTTGSVTPDNGSTPTTPAPPTEPAIAVANTATPSSASAPGTGAPVAAPPSAGSGKTAGKTASSHGGGGTPDPTPDPTPTPAPQPAAKPNINQALAAFDPGGGGGPAAGGGGSTAPFDRGAAAAALGAVNVASCKKSDGPTGSGHVSITFGSNGQVQTAVVDSPPFEGTSVGGCVAGKFRAAHVPGFSGGAQRVGKSFTIN